mgnify:CR=1 FL=1
MKFFARACAGRVYLLELRTNVCKIEKHLPKTLAFGTGNEEGLVIYAEENDIEK